MHWWVKRALLFFFVVGRRFFDASTMKKRHMRSKCHKLKIIYAEIRVNSWMQWWLDQTGRMTLWNVCARAFSVLLRIGCNMFFLNWNNKLGTSQIKPTVDGVAAAIEIYIRMHCEVSCCYWAINIKGESMIHSSNKINTNHDAIFCSMVNFFSHLRILTLQSTTKILFQLLFL